MKVLSVVRTGDPGGTFLVTVLVTIANVPPSPLIARPNGPTPVSIVVASLSVIAAHSQYQVY